MLKLTPPMGWNSWNTFGEDISESLIKETADALVLKGFLEAGYEYLVIDDCWSEMKRDKNGRLVADKTKFPNGMKAVSDYVHSKGLKFGMYSCAGIRTCAGYPGSYDYEFIDAQTFADWGVDFLKYDFCFKPSQIEGELLYRKMAMAIRATGKDILFSACNWGSDNCENWMRQTGAEMYRSTGDIADNFNSFKYIALNQEDKLCYSAPNCFNDMDMLIVGMYGKGNVGLGGCNDIEYRSHFALWCLFNSPLMIGCDIRNISKESELLLKNKNLISINQDSECRPPFKVRYDESYRVYARHLSNNEMAIGFFNFGDEKREIYCFFTDMGLSASSGYNIVFTDVFTNETTKPLDEFFNPEVEAHGCKVYKAKLVKAN